MSEQEQNGFSQNMAEAQQGEQSPTPSIHKRRQQVRGEMYQIAQKDSKILSLGEAERDIQRREELTKELLQIQQELEKIEKAQEIMGEDFMGPEQVANALNLDPTTIEVPPIPFSQAELEKAKQLGQFLILRIDKDSEGNPLTMQRIANLAQTQFEAQDKGRVLRDDITWFQNDSFFTADSLALKWALVSKEVVPGSTRKNYYEQTKTLVAYLKNEIIPTANEQSQNLYLEAIREFETYATTKFANKDDEEIEQLLRYNRQTYSQELANLQINQLCRQTPTEVLYDLIVYFQTNNQRLLENMWAWTNTRDSVGDLVFVGYFDSDGVFVDRVRPGHSRGRLAVSFSRLR